MTTKSPAGARRTSYLYKHGHPNSRRVLLFVWFLSQVTIAARGIRPTFEGTILADGNAVAGVQVCANLKYCIVTDQAGKFHDDSPEWNFTGVLYLRKPGFVPALVSPDRPWTQLKLTISQGTASTEILKPCAEPPVGFKYVGHSMYVLVRDDIEIMSSGAYHGVAFEIPIVNSEGIVWMRLEWQGDGSAFPDRVWLGRQKSFEVAELFLAGKNGQPPRLYALDVRAVLSDGRRSRRIAKRAEYISYFAVPGAAADSFDSMLDTLCVADTTR